MQRSIRTLSGVLNRSVILIAQRTSVAGWKCLATASQADGNLLPVLNVQQLRFYTVKPSGPKFNKEHRERFTVQTAQELKSLIDSDKVFLFDVREPEEVAKGRPPAKRYLNIPLGQMMSGMRLEPDEFEKKYGIAKPGKHDTDVVAMCLVGIRSTWALQGLHEYGYINARHFVGGWTEWNKNYPNDHQKN